MGVMECFRKDCEHILCARLSRKHGYICRDCFEELVRTNPDDIEAFMNTTPQGTDVPKWVEVKFDEEFPLTKEEQI